jgi:hypothetical protein
MDVNYKGQVMTCLFDCEDFIKVSDYKGTWFAKRSTKNRTLYCVIKYYKDDGQRSDMSIHHVIMGKPDWENVVDHFDFNGLNNTKDNLRIVTRSVNGLHSRAQKNNRLGIKGIYPRGDKYRVIKDGKEKYFTELKDAVAYKQG